MRLKKSEQKHMEALGQKWDTALAAASLSARLNPKLVGLDKIRLPLATYAALKATGMPDHDGFAIPREAGEPTIELQEIVDTAYLAAVEAAQRAVA